MKLKILKLLLISNIACAIECCENNIIIRPATLDDLHAIHEFSKNCFQKDFKPVFAQTITTEQKLNCFTDILTKKHQDWCQEFITKQLNQEEYSIIVAHKKSEEKQTPLVGYCRFFKKNAHTIQIGFLGVDELSRRQGIAKKLVFAAINKFNGITECNFRTYSNYDFINKLYGEHNCIITGTALLNTNTGELSTDSTDPNALITLNEYSYVIKK